MARSINSFNFSGNICNDPELRSTKAGLPILTFRVAINNRKKVGEDWQDIPSYINCKSFGKQAESLDRYLSKGTFVVCSGSIWIDRIELDGVKKDMIEVHVDDIVFRSNEQKPAKAGGLDFYDEEVPF